MSFIRCLNNPDGAYVFHSVSGNVEFYTKRYKPFNIPAQKFYGLIKKFIKEGAYLTELSWGGFSIKECDKYSKFELSYNGESIKLWQVTWNYIVNNVEWHFLTRKQRITRLNIRDKY